MKGALALLASIALPCAGAPLAAWWLDLDPNAIDLLNRLSGPMPGHPLGTDELGRDLLLRLLEAGQVSLTVGLVAALAAALIGTTIGMAAGYARGWTDRLLMRLTDAVIALPLLPLLIVVAALDPAKLGIPAALAQSQSAGLLRIVAIAALFGWTTSARLVRGATLVIRHSDFVRAAQALGAGTPRILWRHVLPNVAGPLIVATALSVGEIILLESVLSFLGLGIQPPVASWGNMLTNAQELMSSAPLLAIYPGALILSTVIGCNLLGDGLQRRLDPRRQRR